MIGTLWRYPITGSAFLVTEFDECQERAKGLVSFEQSVWASCSDAPEDEPIAERSFGIKFLQEYCEQIEVGDDGYQQTLDVFAAIYRTKVERLTQELGAAQRMNQAVEDITTGGE